MASALSCLPSFRCPESNMRSNALNAQIGHCRENATRTQKAHQECLSGVHMRAGQTEGHSCAEYSSIGPVEPRGTDAVSGGLPADLQHKPVPHPERGPLLRYSPSAATKNGHGSGTTGLSASRVAAGVPMQAGMQPGEPVRAGALAARRLKPRPAAPAPGVPPPQSRW